jgi:hypothetical protein
LSISQPLAFDALDRFCSAHSVIHAKRDAVRIAEIELGEIAVTVLLFAMLIDALHAALEDRVVALDGVGRNDVVALAADVFVLLVVHGVMASEHGPDLAIPSALLTRTKKEHTMYACPTQEGCMARHMVSALRDLWELASLGAFVAMIALAARAFGA